MHKDAVSNGRCVVPLRKEIINLNEWNNEIQDHYNTMEFSAKDKLSKLVSCDPTLIDQLNLNVKLRQEGLLRKRVLITK